MTRSRAVEHQITTDPVRVALAELFDAQFDSVYRFTLARCGSHVLAEEVTSEVFVDATVAFRRGAVAEVSAGWLITVARRRLIDRWRTADRQRQRHERLCALHEPGHEDELELGEGVVLDALRSLPERQRLAVTLRYLDDFSVSEVATALDVSYSAAESLLSRGRASLSSALEALR